MGIGPFGLIATIFFELVPLVIFQIGAMSILSLGLVGYSHVVWRTADDKEMSSDFIM
ncbi:MAG: hypothetical protein AAGK23_00720 [Pseudomonadota bacterium]